MFFEIFPVLLVVIGLLVVLSGRSEADPDRERPTAIYLSAAAYVGIFVFLASMFAVATGVVNLTDSSPNNGYYSYSVGAYAPVPGIAVTPDDSGTVTASTMPVPDPSLRGGPRPPLIQRGGGVQAPPAWSDIKRLQTHRGHANHDDDVSLIVTGLIVAFLSSMVISFHGRRLRALGMNSSGPGARVYARYLFLVCFTAMGAALVAGGIAIHSIYGVIAPDTAGLSSRADGLRTLVPTAFLALIALGVFRGNFRRSELLNPGPPPPAFTPPAPTPPPAAPAPVKKAVAKKAPAKKKAAAKKAAPRTR